VALRVRCFVCVYVRMRGWGCGSVTLNCVEVIEIVEHRAVVNVDNSVLVLEPSYKIAVDKVETEKGATVLAHSVDREGHTCGGGPIQQEGVFVPPDDVGLECVSKS
jgi:hypothetical protein